MCGITGIVDLRAQQAIDPAVIRKMNTRLEHRGPDGDGFHEEPGVAFGHRRLSIIDIGGGHQPLYNEDHTVVVTYNGEIYNFQALADELKALGHTFRTRCDTEVIVHAWEEWREKCVDRFNGMFAFAIWDQNTEELFLARDRLGIKPLHYYIDERGMIYFGSELKALRTVDTLKLEVDPYAVEDYFAFGYIPDPRSIFKDVHKLEPGCRLLLKRGEPPREPERYWDVPLDQEPSVSDLADAQALLVDRLQGAVQRRLIADVPLGSFLSGGIDSSAVVAMMAKCDIEDILTCSIGFNEARYDESEYAQMVADQLETNHQRETVEATDYDLLDQLIDVYDEPFADSSAIPTYRVCQLARRHVTVALSGDGGDEDFIGYRRYRLFEMEDRARNKLPQFARQNIFQPLGELYPKLDWAPRVFRAKTTFQSLAMCPVEGYRHGVNITQDQPRQRLFSSRLNQDLAGYTAAQVFSRYVDNKSFSDNLRLVQYLDYKTYLPGDILTKVDRASMAHALEVRVPFLDHTFVETAASMSSGLKLAGQEGKMVLKRALEPHLPKEVLYRTKMGFAVPLDMWFRDSLRERISDTMTGERLSDCGLFDPQALSRITREHTSGRHDHSPMLWSLLMFDRFLESVSG